MVNKTNQVDVESIKTTWLRILLPLINIFKALSVEKFFVTFDIIFGPKLESDSVPFRTVVIGQEQKLYLFLVFYAVMLFHLKQPLNYLGDRSLSNLTWVCVFLWCTETKISVSKGSLKGGLL